MIQVVSAVARRSGRYLVGKRSGGSHAGEWEFPGGKVESGESHVKALHREIMEELGVKVRLQAFQGRWFNLTHNPPYELHYYTVILSGEPKALDSHSELRWMTEAEIRALPPEERTPSLIPVLDKVHTHDS